MKLTQEIIEKAKAAVSAEELLAIAKENGIDITRKSFNISITQPTKDINKILNEYREGYFD